MATLAHQSNNPLEVARSVLIDALLRVRVPQPIGDHPMVGDFEAFNTFMRESAKPVDAFFSDLGFVLRNAAPGHLDMTVFDDVVSGTIEGNATWIVEQAAEMVRADMMECV